MMPLDKWAHLLGGAVITLALGCLTTVWLAFLAAVSAGFAKEAYDYFHPDRHMSDGFDFLATFAGGLAAALFLIGVKS